MIVTVTLNPALQVEYRTARFLPGSVNEISQVSHLAGGRGLAVAKVLQMFGHEVVAAGLTGGQAGELIRADLARSGVATQFTPIAAESRRVLLVRDLAAGTVTRLREPAPYITTEELGRLAADYRSLLDGAAAVLLSGSLPAGLPAETYASLVSYATEAGVPVLLNAGGSVMRYGAARRPAMVIPDIATDSGAADAAGQLAEATALLAAGVGAVAVPGPAEVLVLTAGQRWRAWLNGPGIGTGSRAGLDALVAGLVPGIALAWSWPDALAHAVAMTAAWPEHGGLDLEAYERLLPEVEIEQLPQAR